MKYTTKSRVIQAALAVTAACAIGAGALLQSAPHADAVELPEPPQIIGAMPLQAIEEPEKVIAVYSAEPLKRARGVLPEAPVIEEPEPERVYLGSFKVTGYDICVRCCGNTKGITASGTTATVGRTCAAPAGIPFGTRLYIDGIGERIVEDRGGAVKGNKLDILCEDHEACYAITGTRDVWIVEG